MFLLTKATTTQLRPILSMCSRQVTETRKSLFKRLNKYGLFHPSKWHIRIIRAAKHTKKTKTISRGRREVHVEKCRRFREAEPKGHRKISKPCRNVVPLMARHSPTFQICDSPKTNRTRATGTFEIALSTATHHHVHERVPIRHSPQNINNAKGRVRGGGGG